MLSVSLFPFAELPTKGRAWSSKVPSWRDVANDRVLCTYTHIVIDQHQTGASDVVRQGRRHGKSDPAESLSTDQPGGPPCWVSPLAFGFDQIASNYHHV